MDVRTRKFALLTLPALALAASTQISQTGGIPIIAAALAQSSCQFEVVGTTVPPTSGNPVVIDDISGTVISANFFNGGAIDSPYFDGLETVSVCVSQPDSNGKRTAQITTDVGLDNDFIIKGYPEFVVGTKFGNLFETSFRYYNNNGLPEEDRWPVVATGLDQQGFPFEFANLEYVSNKRAVGLPAFTNDLPNITVTLDVDEFNVVGSERDVMLESWFFDTSRNADIIGTNSATNGPIANTLNNIVGVGHQHYPQLDNTLLEMMVHIGPLSPHDISGSKNNPGQNQLTEIYSGLDFDLDGIDDHFDVDSHEYINSNNPLDPKPGIYSSGVDQNGDGIDDADLLPIVIGDFAYSIWYGETFLAPIIIFSRETDTSLSNDFNPNTADMDLSAEGEISLPWTDFLNYTMFDIEPLLAARNVSWATGSENPFPAMRANGGAIGGVEFGVEPQVNNTADEPYSLTINKYIVTVDGTESGIIQTQDRKQNQNPVAHLDTAATTTGGTVLIDVLANDTDPDNSIAPATLQIITAASNGTTNLAGEGSILYTHDGGLNSSDSFSYRVYDEFGATSNVASVEISVTATFLSTCPATIDLGNIGQGIAVRDSASGDGWLMWSSENVFSRFSPTPFTGNAEHLIAVTFQNSQWHYDNNSVLTPFTPSANDCIVAELDFTNDTATTLTGTSTTINGIDAGYLSGDLIITPDIWRGTSNDGEFGINGTQLSNQPNDQLNDQPISQLSTCPATMDLGNIGQGIAVRDSASDNGWLMWSSQNVFSRFSPKPLSGNAAHLIAVTFHDSQWHYDNNTVSTPFTPAPDDCIVAELDFTNDTATTLTGTSTTINGIDAGYLSGDLIITPDIWRGTSNDGEFGINGTQLSNQPNDQLNDQLISQLSTCPATMDLGNIGQGIAVRDSASGDGWLMWSSENVFSRFSPKPLSGNADHLIAVTFQNSQWHFDNNSVLTPFTPSANDCIVAELDFTNDTATTLQGITTTINGIDAGYQSGDLIITPDIWRGVSNNGEFGVIGTSLE